MKKKSLTNIVVMLLVEFSLSSGEVVMIKHYRGIIPSVITCRKVRQ